ncbi:hypothetical protein BS50DRAFT_446299, partial [Corynespora cassiicola Philippines]
AAPPLRHFIQAVIGQADVEVPILACTILYMRRLKSRVGGGKRIVADVPHRVFLACLILSEKYHSDDPRGLSCWSHYSEMSDDYWLAVEDIAVMEKQAISLLDWKLDVCEDELEGLMEEYLA